MFKKKIGVLLASTMLVGALAVGCGSNTGGSGDSGDSSKVSVSGSTSIGPLMETIGEKFQEKNKGVSVEVQQIGSSGGIKNAIEGTSEIGMSSRDLKDEEKSAGLKETKIAIDGIALITNTANPVKNLTMDQVKGIYTGKITNWKEVGGNDAPIVIVSREEGSGTRDAFQEIVGYESEELTKDASISDGSGAVKTTVAGNKNAIGFASFEYIDDTVSALSVNDVEPTAENVKAGDYKISRPFLLVTSKDTLTDEGQKLIDFVLSSEGQQIVKDNKLITIE